jgi:1-deoxy-D-xylulose-5-phosphate synthase
LTLDGVHQSESDSTDRQRPALRPVTDAGPDVPVGRVLERVTGPADLRGLSEDELTFLAAELRELVVATVARNGGHLGPNLGIVELTLALHRVFDSPAEPILFDVGHQAYVHKMLTGRAAVFASLRTRGGLSGYPRRAESPHDWIENSHASTALSYADGMAKALALRGEHRPVVAVVGDGALTGGMCWEALNNIAGADNPVVIVVNDNGRSYDPTIGGLARRLAAVRARPGYESFLHGVKRFLPRLPVAGPAMYAAAHGLKRGMKDVLSPQGLFEDLGLKYVGPVDGHDRAAIEQALQQARGFGGPVIVHCITAKGRGYRPAETDPVDRMHQSTPFDVSSGQRLPSVGRPWTAVFADEIVEIGAQRDDVVAISAAMCDPTGLRAFARRFPDRFYDVGIAEQHAVTSAAGLASAGLHPVVAIYATFLNRAFDQVLMDVALHRLPVTFVLDRAGITGSDGPSHNGVWDLAVLSVVPGLRIAAPRDEDTLRDELREAVAHDAGPTAVRFPKTTLPRPMPAVRRVAGVDVVAEPEQGAVDVLLVAIGSCAELALKVAQAVGRSGASVRVVDPRWVQPLDPALIDLASEASIVATVEDGLTTGGVGSRLAAMLRDADVRTPLLTFGVESGFLDHGTVPEVKEAAGLCESRLTERIRAALAADGRVGSFGMRDRDM